MSLPENKITSLHAELDALENEFSLEQEGRKIKRATVTASELTRCTCFYLQIVPMNSGRK